MEIGGVSQPKSFNLETLLADPTLDPVEHRWPYQGCWWDGKLDSKLGVSVENPTRILNQITKKQKNGKKSVHHLLQSDLWGTFNQGKSTYEDPRVKGNNGTLEDIEIDSDEGSCSPSEAVTVRREKNHLEQWYNANI
ncbi:hypothetical protein G9A89_013493 [Geosiphon pyriformis]|nr:hypothetical protein G9A89_013493 [Geosiphon pyriformis]